MKALRALFLVVFVSVVVVVPSSIGRAAVVDAFPVCIGTESAGLGAPAIDFTLVATPAGSSFQLTGQAQFSQSIAPPGSLVVYGVSGTAIQNADGFWISLTGTGYDLAKTVFIGMFALQLSADATKNTLTYAKQSLDASSTVVVSGVPEVRPCP